MPVTSPLSQHSTLVQTDRFCLQPAFETGDQESLWAVDTDEEKVFGLNPLSNPFQFVENPLKILHDFSPREDFFDQNIMILRC
jgi:hypothetical protein